MDILSVTDGMYNAKLHPLISEKCAIPISWENIHILQGPIKPNCERGVSKNVQMRLYKLATNSLKKKCKKLPS